MAQLTQRLLSEARSATTIEEYWRRAAAALREWSASTRVTITYTLPAGPESGSAEAGTPPETGAAAVAVARTWSDPAGRRVEASFFGSPALPGPDALDTALDTAAQLAS